jgi:SNF2 family DNA or RNA helicase
LAEASADSPASQRAKQPRLDSPAPTIVDRDPLDLSDDEVVYRQAANTSFEYVSDSNSDDTLDSDGEFDDDDIELAESHDFHLPGSGTEFADSIQAHRDRLRRGTPPVAEHLLRAVLDDIPLDEDAPVGYRTRAKTKRRLVRKGEADGARDDGRVTIDDAFDDSEPETEIDRAKAIENERKRIDAAATDLGLKKMSVVTYHNVEIIEPDSNTSNDQAPGPPAAEADAEDEMEYIESEKLTSKETERKFREVREKKEMYRAPGMKTALLNHQVLGVDWMIKHEFSTKKPVGGLVADAMGLGKTIQAIATMCLNPPQEGDPKVTLIVAPPALLAQWKDEIERHCKKNQFSVHIHHGATRIKTVKELAKKDVVLCTYHAVLNSYPKRPKDRKNMTVEQYNAWWSEAWETRDILHRLKFWRVILDECHIIKNRRGQISEACQSLQAVNTWALSGTPIQNAVEDIYPILSFLKHPTCQTYEAFRELVPTKAEPMTKARRVQALLRGNIMRRTKKDMLLGEPLVVLPKKRIQILKLYLDREEKALYDAVEAHARNKINKYMRQGTEMKHYAGLLTMLLRLRQICDHPYLILSMVNEDFTAADLDRALGMAPENPTADALDSALGASMENAENSMVNALDSSIDNSAKTMDFTEFIRNGDGSMLKDNPSVLSRILHNAKNNAPAPSAKGKKSKAPAKKGGRGRKKQNPDLDEYEDEEEPGMGDEDIETPDVPIADMEFLHSTKTKGIMEQLDAWRRNHPDDKIVLFSAFTKMLDIMQKVLDDSGEWGYARYQGGMTMQERHEALQQFRTDSHCQIMLMSIKAGGVGLNLVEANLIISVDLWWNAATELQAFDRVHRLGQKKQVFITRFVTVGTVEERILRLQKSKLAMAKAALGEGKTYLGKMTREELLGLFVSILLLFHHRVQKLTDI